MTIDEAIEKLKNYRYLSMQSDLQIAEWLEELKFLRTTKETMYREIYNKAIDDFMHDIEKDARYAEPIEIIEVDRCRYIAEQLKEKVERMTREEMRNQLRILISNLKSMADEFEILYNEMDNISDEVFDAKSEYIQDKYSECGIELF